MKTYEVEIPMYYKAVFRVEAESEVEAIELILSGEFDCDNVNYDNVEYNYSDIEANEVQK